MHAEIDGRPVIMQAHRNGFSYVLDRETGEHVAANPFVDEVNSAEGVDLETGRPIHTEVYEGAVSSEEVTYRPSAFGGKDWMPMSYDAESRTVFLNTLNIGMTYKAVEPQHRPGTFFGAEFSWVWPEGEDAHRGSLRAIDPMTGEVKWQDEVEIPRFAGVLSTGGDLVFTGTQTGEFEAFDAETGEKLWEHNVGSGIVGQPVTWEHEGKQYVTVASGSGAVYTLFSGDERLADTPAGGSIWTFAPADRTASAQ